MGNGRDPSPGAAQGTEAKPVGAQPAGGQPADLARTVERQRRTIDALVAAAERRTAGGADATVLASWQRNVHLQQRVAERGNQLREVERLLCSVIDSLDAGLCILTADGRIIDANRAWSRMLAAVCHRPIDTDSLFALAQYPGDGLGELLREAMAATRDLFAGRRAETSDVHRVLAHGRERWWRVHVDRVHGHDTARAVVTLTDVTRQWHDAEELRRATRDASRLAEELALEKAVLDGVISAIPHLTYWKDYAGRYQGCNEAFRTARGLDSGADIIGRADGELPGSAEFSQVLATIEAEVARTGRSVLDQRYTVGSTTGPPRSLLLSVLPQLGAGGHLDGLIGVGADVTLVTELERQVNQANRLEAIGQLAAGIAHEINTPIQFVSDNTRFVADNLGIAIALAQVARDIPEQPDPDQAVRLLARLREVVAAVDIDFLVAELPVALSESLEGLDRVAQIVRAMKDFSHPGQGRRETDLNRAVESTAHVARSEWKYQARLELDLDPGVGLVPCYEGEFKQVVLNLIVNAAHAIEDVRAGTDADLGLIRITTARLDDRVEVCVTDTGTGMDQATQQRIFDPFFTTKGVGKGTGQGLSMAYASIVRKHGGAIRVESAPGRGATFVISLPTTVEPGPEPAD